MCAGNNRLGHSPRQPPPNPPPPPPLCARTGAAARAAISWLGLYVRAPAPCTTWLRHPHRRRAAGRALGRPALGQPLGATPCAVDQPGPGPTAPIRFIPYGGERQAALRHRSIRQHALPPPIGVSGLKCGDVWSIRRRAAPPCLHAAPLPGTRDSCKGPPRA